MNPYVFVVGCPRSGTTLLQRLLDAHPQLAVIHETQWIVRVWNERIGLAPDGSVRPELVAELPRQARFRALRMDQEDLARVYHAKPGRPYAELVSTLFDRVGERKGKRLVGDKTPGYVRWIPTLHALWPEARYVHIVRDGRDVWLSVREWQMGPVRRPTWQTDPVATTALWWDWNVRLGREAGAELGGDLYHELRYEDLVDDPEPACRELCAFLGLPYAGTMLQFHEGRVRDDPGLDAKLSWKPVTRGLRDWQAQMSRDEVATFEAAAGRLLDELGYGRSTDPADGDLLERVAAIRRAFADEVRERRRPVPAEWAAAVR